MEGSAAMVEQEIRHLERCRTCSTVLPSPPAPRVCTNCGAVKVTPLHGLWPHSLKVFLLIRAAARHLFPEWRGHQASWELLLTTNYERRFVGGKLFKQGCNPDDVFAIAVKEAEEWGLAGGKTDFL
jgi:hypothetical protein